ncbi:hypothetical protein ABIB27_001744 [Arthrobacter sp. UYEF21]
MPEDGAGVMERTESDNGLSVRVAGSWRFLKQGRRPRRTVHYLSHYWKLRSLSRSLAKALGESWEASSWPGDRLAVGIELSEKVEKLTLRLNRETEVHGRLVALLK